MIKHISRNRWGEKGKTYGSRCGVINKSVEELVEMYISARIPVNRGRKDERKIEVVEFLITNLWSK